MRSENIDSCIAEFLNVVLNLQVFLLSLWKFLFLGTMKMMLENLKEQFGDIKAQSKERKEDLGLRKTCSAGNIPNLHVTNAIVKIFIEGSRITAHN